MKHRDSVLPSQPESPRRCLRISAARNGLLTLSDNRGHILAEAASASDRFVAVSGKVNVTRERTFYAKTGDWFALLRVGSFVLLLITTVREPKIATNNG